MNNAGLLELFADRLPAGLAASALTLGEGATPLLKLVHLPAAEGIDLSLHVKVEGANPTGSFKDRGMVAAVAHALQTGAKGVICASTGNTSASAAAYAARADLACYVLLPAGKVAAGKLAQAIAHGATILSLKGNFDDAMQAVRELDSSKFSVVNSINPMRIQGQKTIAFEVIAQLGRPPDIHALPVGNAGNITAHWIGYSEACGLATAASAVLGKDWQPSGPAIVSTRPQMLGVQASGAAPFLAGKPIAEPETVATAIRIGNPQSWDSAQAAVSESSGRFTTAHDDELLRVQAALGELEGVFCEPASAASVAGVIAEARAGKIPSGSTVVCTLTGNGMKDPDVIAPRARITEIAADKASVAAALDIN